MSDTNWCHLPCIECERLVNVPLDSGYCSVECETAAGTPRHDDDDEYDDESCSYSSWHRVSLWAQNVSPTPPLSPRVFASPSKRILTPQYPTACITTDEHPVGPTTTKHPTPSPPRPARTSAAESLAASSAPPPASPIDLLVRLARPHLPRLTTANFTVFAKTHPPPPVLDESDSDVSPVWWAPPEPDSSRSSPTQPRFFVSRRTPAAPRGRKSARTAA